MNRFSLLHILFFLLVIAVQLLFLNNIGFSGYINPYIYIIIILLLPLAMPEWGVLLTAFFTGLLFDIMAGTMGVHASATVTAAFVRPYLLRYIAPSDGYESMPVPSMANYGFSWFARYSLLMIFIHHTVLFYMEVFRFDDFFRTLLRVLLSTLFSWVVLLLAERYRASFKPTAR